MAANEIEICNAALSMLGASPITSLSDTDKRSVTCNLWYSRTRDNLLRSHPWGFALKRAALELDLFAPSFGYTSKFVLPVDYLRVYKMEYPDIEYKIEGGSLLTNEDTIKLVYIAKITNPVLFDPMFDHVLAVNLAHNMSYSLVQSVSLKAQLAQEIQILIRDARSADAQESSPDNFQFDTWLEARY
jgi:hypothetical protein